MSSDTIPVELQAREAVGKGLSHLRNDGKIPAVIHERGKESLHVMADYPALAKVYAQAGKHHPVQLRLGGKKQLAMIKDADFHPAKNRLRHVVFQAIKQNEKVTAEVPVSLVGEEIPAEKASLIILTQLDTVEVEALPNDLPDRLEVDAMVLAEVGDKLTVADIKAPAGVTIVTDPESQIAVVEMPKDQLAEANAAAEALAEDAVVSGATDEEKSAHKTETKSVGTDEGAAPESREKKEE